ncbi:MAG: diguanylate cyclase [Ferruginibacter sp.]|nr:diguanylate cyclase [Rhodoferax sp.]
MADVSSLTLLRAVADTLDSLGIAACVFDDADNTLLWNQSYLQFFPEHAAHVYAGEPYRDNLRRFYQVRLAADELAHIDQYIDRSLARHRSQQQPCAFEHWGMWLRVASVPLPGMGGIRIWQAHTLATDPQSPTMGADTAMDGAALLMAERMARENEAILQEKSALLEATLAAMGQGVMMVNADGVVVVCNRRARELLNLPQSLVDSRPTLDALTEYLLAAGEPDHVPEDLLTTARTGDVFDRPSTFERKCRDGRVVEIHSTPIAGGGVLRTYTDITGRKQAEERIRHMARHDELTALVNREVFLQSLAAAASATDPAEGGFAVHFIDLDRFKPINDHYGHAIGDKVLAQAADRLRTVARDGDVVARMGGDEFAVLQSRVEHPDQALGLAYRLLDGIGQDMQIGSHRLEVGASIGVALCPGAGSDADTLLRNADVALYAAKAQGRDCVRVFGAHESPASVY